MPELYSHQNTDVETLLPILNLPCLLAIKFNLPHLGPFTLPRTCFTFNLTKKISDHSSFGMCIVQNKDEEKT